MSFKASPLEFHIEFKVLATVTAEEFPSTMASKHLLMSLDLVNGLVASKRLKLSNCSEVFSRNSIAAFSNEPSSLALLLFITFTLSVHW